MSLESITQLGRVEVEQKVTDNLVVKLRTLTASEYAQVMKTAGGANSPDVAALSTLGHLAELQIMTLSFATISMNGQTGTSEEFRKVYQNIQYPLLLEVYSTYMQIVENQNKVLDSLKKNLTTPLLETTT